MSFENFELTQAGHGLHVKSLLGDKLNFTKIGVGNGKKPTDIWNLTALQNEILQCDIEKAEIVDDHAEITFSVSNENVEYGFEWTEVGVYAQGESEEDVLYCYAHCGEKKSYINSNSETFRYEGVFVVSIYIGSAENVTATVKATAYARREEFEDHIKNYDNPHKVTKAQVGLGLVPNVATNDQSPTFSIATSLEQLKSGEKLSVAFGKIARAVANLINHIKDGTLHTTEEEKANWNGKASSTHTHSATDINLGTFSVARGGTGVTSYSALGAALNGYVDIFQAGTTEPTNKKIFWIDTTDAEATALKYYDGTTWVALSTGGGGNATWG